METPLYVGCDVAKDEHVVACSQASFAPWRVANRRGALSAWLASLPAGSRIAVESTGGYHELVVELACARGLLVYVLNPRDLRHYARGVGQRGKTDRVDAELIARYLEREHAHLHPWAPASAEQREIARLLRRRAEISRARSALAQSLQGEPALAEELAALKRQFDTLLAKLDERLARLVGANPGRGAEQKRLASIYGFGPLLSSYLAALFERITFHSANAFVAFTGYDPRPNDSGQRSGRRRLSKRGPAELRRLLFLAAMNWSRTEQGRALYEHYRARGLPTTAALVALARKLARIAFALHQHGTTFDSSRFAHA